MNPTDLSAVVNLEQLADDAISRGQKLKLADLNMAPFVSSLPNSKCYPVPDMEYNNMAHFMYIMNTVMPDIFNQVPRALSQSMKFDLGLSEVFKNAFEEAIKVNALEIKVGYSDLKTLPVEFDFYSSLTEISPIFAKYWKYQKTKTIETGFPDDNKKFYDFAPNHDKGGLYKLGCGIIIMLNSSKDCNFYLGKDGTLLTHVVFDKE
jgi:hypothetical protein